MSDENESYNWYSSSYNRLFPENINELIDTVIIDTTIKDIIDTNKVNYDINVKSGKIVFDDSLKMNFNIPENINIKSEVIDTTIKNKDLTE